MPYSDPAKRREASARWRQENPRKNQESYRNSPGRQATNKLYRENNKEHIRVKNSAYKQQKRLEIRAAIFELLGGPRCGRCGYDADIRALQLDHINGGGYRQRQGLRSPDTYYKTILETKGEGFQVLCANCNQIKRYERSEVTSRKRNSA